jgi:hypothetical protein
LVHVTDQQVRRAKQRHHPTFDEVLEGAFTARVHATSSITSSGTAA